MKTPAHHRTDSQGWPTPWPARRKAAWPRLTVESDAPTAGWVDRAACHGQWAAFDPTSPFEGRSALRERVAAARRICDRCPVFDACAEFARTASPAVTGIYAGQYRTANTTSNEGNTPA